MSQYNKAKTQRFIPMPNPLLIPYGEALFAVIVWGASFIATKVVLHDISPIAIVWLRFSIGMVVLGITCAMRKQISLPGKGEWGYFAVLGFLGITFHQWLQSNALQTSEAGTTAWIVSTTPVFMALLGWLVLQEGLKWIKILGIILAFVGVLLVVSKGDFSSISIGTFGKPGDRLIMVSAMNWAVFSVLSRRGLKSHPASLMMFHVMAFGWIFTSILFFAGNNLSEYSNLTGNGWLAILFLGIFCSGLAYVAWYDALQVLPAAQTGAFLYIEPVVAVVFAFFVLDEAITVASVIGGGVILLGVWLVNQK